jgi:hypothetical protein
VAAAPETISVSRFAAKCAMALPLTSGFSANRRLAVAVPSPRVSWPPASIANVRPAGS